MDIPANHPGVFLVLITRLLYIICYLCEHTKRFYKTIAALRSPRYQLAKLGTCELLTQ